MTYSGSSQSPTWSNYDITQLEISGDTNGTNAGTYTAIFTPKEGYKWSDGSVIGKSVAWTIGKATISTVPNQSSVLTYTGSSLSPTWSNYDSNKMTIGGTTSATNAGSYKAKFTPKSNYMWSDGSTEAKSVTWKINKKSISTVPSQSGTLTANGSSQSPTWSNYDSNKMTIGGTTSATNAGSYTATFTPKSNYQWSDGTTTAKSVTWTIKANKPTLVAWSSGTNAQIKAMIDGYYNNLLTLDEIKSVWKVGDKRSVTLSAMSATNNLESHRSQTVQYVIIDFDHDTLTTAINGHTKALLTLNQDKILISSDSKTTSNGDSETGKMNPSTLQYDDWGTCARRTWCNSTYYNAIPSGLRSLIKPVTIYYNDGSNLSSVLSCSDYTFLLSDVGIAGSGASTYLQNYDTQYEYFKTTSNRYKLPTWSSSHVSTSWWERSPLYNRANAFCRMNNDGTAGYNSAVTLYGISPVFCI